MSPSDPAGRYRVAEWSCRSAVEYANPWRDVELSFVFTTPAGRELRVPAFWAGGRRWCARYSSGEVGEHRFRTECSDPRNGGLHGRIGAVRVVEAAGENRVDLHRRTGAVRVVEGASDNPLFRRGPVEMDPSRTHLRHADGTPFFWLADTWWMGLAERLRWPEDVQRLTADRVAKGFTVVQIVAGLYPDMEPFDERARNEAGFPWDRRFSRINPAYFDAADRRIMHLVEAGIVPCIVGAWGFFVDVAGAAAMRDHWRYLVARWARAAGGVVPGGRGRDAVLHERGGRGLHEIGSGKSASATGIPNASGHGLMSPARSARWTRSAGRSRSIRPVRGAPRSTIRRCWTSRCCRPGTWVSRRSRTRST